MINCWEDETVKDKKSAMAIIATKQGYINDVLVSTIVIVMISNIVFWNVRVILKCLNFS